MSGRASPDVRLCLLDTVAAVAVAGDPARDLHITVDRTGSSRIGSRLDPEATAAVRGAIDAFAKPLSAAKGTLDPHSVGQRNADALYQLCRVALDTEALPQRGSKPQIIVTAHRDWRSSSGRLVLNRSRRRRGSFISIA